MAASTAIEHRGRNNGDAAFGPTNVGSVERIVSVIGGGALAYAGWRRGGALGTGLVVVGGALAARGATGYCPAYGALGLTPSPAERRIAAERGWSRAVLVEHSVTINLPRAEVYRFYRDFANLPRFMRHVERVIPLSDRRSHWVVRAPGGRTVEWDSEIEDERANERIAWRSVAGAEVRNSGVVSFRDAPGGRGTEVTARIVYEPPMGPLGRALAKLFGEEPGRQAGDDLRRLKQFLEAGEVPTVEGQPHGPR